MIALHQRVRVTRDLPAQRVAEAPTRAYEIEFVDAAGRTVLQATLTEDALEAL